MSLLSNLWGSSSIWHFLNNRPSGRVSIIVAANKREYELVLQEAEFFFSKAKILPFPEYTQDPYEEARVLPEVFAKRAYTLDALLHHDGTAVLITTPYGLLKSLPPKEVFKSASAKIDIGSLFDREELEYILAYSGYVHVEMVEGAGEYAFRGDILEVFPADSEHPCLIEFFDDEVERISYVDIRTRKTLEVAKSVKLLPASEALFDLDDIKKNIIDTDTLDKIEMYGKYAGCHWLTPAVHNMETLIDYVGDSYNFLFFNEDYRSLFSDFRVLIDDKKPESDEPYWKTNFLAPTKLLYHMTTETVNIFADIVTADSEQLHYRSSSMLLAGKKGNLYQSMSAAMEVIKKLTDEGYRVVCSIESDRLGKVFSEFSRDYGYMPASVAKFNEVDKAGLYLHTEKFRGGFADDKYLLGVITDEDIFGTAKKRPKRGKKELYSTTISDLESGDYVVHIDYGIGLYLGLVHKDIGGVEGDFIQLEYDNDELLYVPLSSIGQIQKYIGNEGAKPRVSSLQTQTWKKVKAQAKARAKKIAMDLLKLYAQRKVEKGFSFTDDGHVLEDFEQRFEYDETEDQLAAIHDVYRDMEASLPMERLVCGYVGFGKTEVAMRAACKAVAGGKQVAILVPTTVLARQHYLTFFERFKDSPVTVDYISRFRNAKDTRDILAKLAKKDLDILIGTHKMLSKDVEFADLGLLVIDEEQRFGVSHKEKIKAMRSNVDVLYLSATPIPRTLQLSLSGIRDISTIDTPPMDRLPVITKVIKRDQETKNAIQRELERGGQVYFLHNRIEDIATVAAGVRSLLPGANISVAHGQMSSAQLEKILMEFYSGKTDVLISTAIIENGIDISNANTIIINNAASLGLAQIYQLKGRVGRSTRRGYCYLVVEQFSALTEVAQKRLKIIQQLSDLGSGVKIAFYDLQIRGAGDLLGADQSGFMVKVGYELFIAIIDEAVKDLKGISSLTADTEIITGIPHYIPADYIEDTKVRLDYYRKFSETEDMQGVQELLYELSDRYGDLKEETENLGRIMLIKKLAGFANMEKIYLYSNKAKMVITKGTPINPQRVMESIAKVGAGSKFDNEFTLSLYYEKGAKVLDQTIKFINELIKVPTV
ncbi:MAG: transcription-repair coupling factor [Denitrovibrio sp.]|nr:MAG: transcription-repair coupling factor [Denitrovibrio sp.]